MNKATLVCLAVILVAALSALPLIAVETVSTAAQSETLTAWTERLKLLQREVDHAESDYRNAGNEADSERAWKIYAEKNDTNLVVLLELAKQHPDTEPAFDAFLWIANNRRSSSADVWPHVLQAVEMLSQHHATHAELGPFCARAAHYWDHRWRFEVVTNFFQTVSEQNPERIVRGQALLALAKMTKAKAQYLEAFENKPASPTDTEAAQKARVEYLKWAESDNSAAATERAEKLFARLINEYGDCPYLRSNNSTLAQTAKAELRELTSLGLGKTAPEIVGEDLDGKEMKLSDYRGKVVVLNFWASWCGPCMQMVPAERDLARKFAKQPFALVGVNGDTSRKTAQQAAKNEKMTWKSFWNGSGGPAGGIASDWNVKGWPTVYILDANGKIRRKFSGYGGESTDKALNETVEQLLAEIDMAKH